MRAASIPSRAVSLASLAELPRAFQSGRSVQSPHPSRSRRHELHAESHHRERPGPRNPGFARQSDRRGRRHAGVGRHRHRGGPVGRVDRRARGARAARRRQEALPRQGRAQGRARTSPTLLGPVVRRARRASTRPASTRRCWPPTARRTRARSAPTRCSASRWRRRAPRPTSWRCRSTSTSAARARACCRCR